jgi:hypothetical protein
MAPVIYPTLDSPDTQFRLLDVVPGQRRTAVECITRFVSLGDTNYTALSYAWGDPKETAPITFNGCRNFPVTSNLAAALQHLRDGAETVTLWVDALCINQKDDHEKRIQIGHMKDIYSNASDTCIWLGERTPDSDIAMDIIEALDGDDLSSPRNNISPQGFEAIANLQQRAWWFRVWVIQGEFGRAGPIFPY